MLAAGLAVTAAAQDKTYHLVPTETCTPWSRNVILGLCTKTQELEARDMPRQPSGPIFGSKPKTPPPAKGETDIAVRLHAEETSALDAWIAAQPDRPSRSEAVRRLVQKGLGS
jgi:hypothetical protein